MIHLLWFTIGKLRIPPRREYLRVMYCSVTAGLHLQDMHVATFSQGLIISSPSQTCEGYGPSSHNSSFFVGTVQWIKKCIKNVYQTFIANHCNFYILKCLWNEFFPLLFVTGKCANLRICIKILLKKTQTIRKSFFQLPVWPWFMRQFIKDLIRVVT